MSFGLESLNNLKKGTLSTINRRKKVEYKKKNKIPNNVGVK